MLNMLNINLLFIYSASYVIYLFTYVPLYFYDKVGMIFIYLFIYYYFHIFINTIYGCKIHSVFIFLTEGHIYCK